ncbi:hypothetical protein CBR_g12100 [Chara braunii]|uniref:Integrase catalytic domain-containing protein n=1 Tax=Chara braunii TaxID=69332 RepID=A0A388KR71_CHABU|nr:hypothetical protein CBR_g12100 [Chara braunii]|eukprot:GBG72529.1 hypothetical protein CBR_g12100 [Chara braunii]
MAIANDSLVTPQTHPDQAMLCTLDVSEALEDLESEWSNKDPRESWVALRKGPRGEHFVVEVDVGGRKCGAFIDIGSTRNYISRDCLERLHLQDWVRHLSRPVASTLANKERMIVTYYIKDVVCTFSYGGGELNHKVSFLVSDDLPFDMLLGMYYLEVAKAQFDWDKKALKHKLPDGRTVRLTKFKASSIIDTYGCLCASAFYNYYKQNQEEGMYLVYVSEKGEAVKTPPEIERVVAKFPDLFEEPTGVVEREVVHSIEIIPGNKFIVLYLDDILIFSKSAEEHAQHVETVLSLLRQHKYKVNQEKCECGRTKILYLGHEVSAEGIGPEDAKVANIRDWPRPQIVTEVGSFLGMCGYYRNFVKNYSTVASPLTDLTRLDTPWDWSDECEGAFKRLKHALMNHEVLMVLDPQKPFIVTTDASQHGIGAVLAQQDGKKLRPIEYMSKKMPSKKLAKSTYERELYALYKALVHWRHFLLGRFFYLRTDHQTLKWIKTQSALSDALKRWIEVIDQYDFKLEYRKGEYNKVADALSRREDYIGSLVSDFGVSEEVTQSLVGAYQEDPVTIDIMHKLQAKDKATERQSVSMDFMDTLVTSKSGKRHIFVIIDRFTKYARLVAMPETARTDHVIKLFQDNWVGERVWVKASELGQEFGISRKLMPQYFGPSEVLDVVGDEMDGPTYVIRIPGHLRTHPVFHASKLAPFAETDQFPSRRSMLPPTMDGQVDIDDIVDHRDLPVQKPLGKERPPKPKRECRVRFRHHTDPKEDRWFTREELIDTAPQVVAEYERMLKGKASANTARGHPLRGHPGPEQARLLDELLDRVRRLEQQLTTANPAGPSNLTDRVNVLEIDVDTLKDGALATNQRIDQQICVAAASPTATTRGSIPKFDGLPIFCDATKTDPIPWWRQFELKLDIHHVINPNRHAYLYSRSGGACQAWLDNMLSTHNIAVSELHTKINWADLKAAWHKRFQVEPPRLQAVEKLQRFYQNDLPSTDWITEYQRLACTPNLSSTFVAIKHFFIRRSCPALQNALTQVAKTLTTSEQLFDKASQIIVTNIEAKNLGHSSAAGQGRGQHRAKVAVVAAATVTDPSNEAASYEEGDKLAAARDGGRPARGRGRGKSKTHTNSSPGAWTSGSRALDTLQYVGRRVPQTPIGKVSTSESDAAAHSTPLESVASRATSLHSEAHAKVDSPLLYSYEDYAARLVPSLGSQAQGQDECAASSPSDNNNNESSSSGSSRDSTHEFNIEVLDPLTSEDFAWLPLPSTGCLSGPQCAALCAHLHTYLAFYAPPPSPTDDEAAVGDILAYVSKVAREFRTQQYDDNNAPLLYVSIQVGQAFCSALLDSGATRNSISQSFIQRAGLGAQVRRKPNPTAIKLADGWTQQLLNRYIQAVKVYFAPHACEPATFDVLDTDFDIILGMPWLASADHTVNFLQRTLTVRNAFGAEVPEAIAMDITGPFPKHKTGVDGILTVADRLTKFAMFLPCRYHAKAPELAEVLYAGWIRTKGYPKEILCDHDTRFMSDFWLALTKRWGSSLKPSSARHPQTDGQTERAHQTAQVLLRTLIRPDQKDWVERLPDVELAYNSSIHPTIRMSPFEFEHGSPVTSPLDTIIPRTAESDDHLLFLRRMQELLVKALDQMAKTQQRMSQQANR